MRRIRELNFIAVVELLVALRSTFCLHSALYRVPLAFTELAEGCRRAQLWAREPDMLRSSQEGAGSLFFRRRRRLQKRKAKK